MLCLYVCNVTCACLCVSCSILVSDEFGDGWNGLSLTVEHPGQIAPVDPTKKKVAHEKDPNAFFSSFSLVPDTEHNPREHRVCASLDADRYYQRGKYILEIKHNYSVPNDWEIQYQVATRSSDYNNWQYGGLNTRMEFDFTSDGVFVMTRLDRPMVRATECHRCKHPAPKPPPGADPAVLPRIPHPDDTLPPTPAVPVHKVPFVLHDAQGDGWFAGNGLGTKFSISDKGQHVRLAEGTICGDVLKEDCETELPDGDYYFRVGGGADESREQVTWTFCGVHGKAMQQLSFAIMNGKCVAGHLSNAVDMVGREERTALSMRGEMILSNVYSEELSFVDTLAVETAVANILRVDSSEVMVRSVCVTRGKEICSVSDDDDENGSRRLQPAASTTSESELRMGGSALSVYSTNAIAMTRTLSQTYSLDIVFVVSIVTEDYSVRGSLYHDTRHLFDKKKILLDEAFRGRTAQGEVRYSASSVGSTALAFAHVEHIVPLRLSGISYKFESGSDAPTPSPRVVSKAAVEKVVMDESTEQAELVLVPFALVGVTLLVIAVAIARRRAAGADTVRGGEEGAIGSPILVGGWRSKVLGEDSGVRPPSSADVSPVQLTENTDAETDLYRIATERGLSRYRQTEGLEEDVTLRRDGLGESRMVHISGAASAARGGASTSSSPREVSDGQCVAVICSNLCRCNVQSIVRNELHIGHDEESSV